MSDNISIYLRSNAEGVISISIDIPFDYFFSLGIAGNQRSAVFYQKVIHFQKPLRVFICQGEIVPAMNLAHQHKRTRRISDNVVADARSEVKPKANHNKRLGCRVTVSLYDAADCLIVQPDSPLQFGVADFAMVKHHLKRCRV